MEELLRTVFYEKHVSLGAKMVEFGGWDMPVQYETGIVQEHLNTRKQAGLFDVSHMGRFIVSGSDALPFLQHVLTNNAAALEIEESQYTMIPDDSGGAIDDAYLYRFWAEEYLLVVNASNRKKDWQRLAGLKKKFGRVKVEDRTRELCMLSLQGPKSKLILSAIMDGGRLPEPLRNSLSTVQIGGHRVFVARTGYTGEPICFELFMNRKDALMIWDLLMQQGVLPVGLGARDTLRLEAGLPLYGHELGLDPADKPIPIFACNLARFAVSFSPLKGEFVGRQALSRQFEAFKKIVDQDYELMGELPRLIQPIELQDKGIARAGAPVLHDGKPVGFVTSGTMVPYWESEGSGLATVQSEDRLLRAIGLALVDSNLVEGDQIQIEIRGQLIRAVVVPYFLRNEAPPYCWPIRYEQLSAEKKTLQADDQTAHNVRTLIQKAAANTVWRQKECINLIPSEQSYSSAARLLSIMDPVSRYAEHKQVKAFKEADIFYYQGTDFISEVECLLQAELQTYLGCTEVETRVISGQMANVAVFSALVDYLNRADRKREQRRIRKVMNNHIIKGGHLSAQPMGALRDFVMRDPKWEKPAAVNFPVLADNPYRIDMEVCRELISEHRPELIILGKSMIIHREPVAEIRAAIDEIGLDCILMYDMAHVLGLVGPYFQQPFKEGADIVTGSTHKTFFGTQRGIVAANYKEEDFHYDFWEAIQRRSFPGSLSNHHLGTLLGLLLAAYEMNYFKEDYQQAVLNNAKAFAMALKDCGLDVAGDPAISYTETHQVILNVGYAKGAEIAGRLEDNNIVLNYQAAPDEEGFTASGSLRTGVQEMTRFGMVDSDFGELAQLMAEVILKGKAVKGKVRSLRQRFLNMQYCFSGQEFEEQIEELHQLV
ncbi:MAG: glycine cleavage system aminomethyltransferase GcvT [bacterium]|nr:glycine cleavage system aminomethyltransferase GcvT [bacterium]